jgi:hypothetical protein
LRTWPAPSPTVPLICKRSSPTQHENTDAVRELLETAVVYSSSGSSRR